MQSIGCGHLKEIFAAHDITVHKVCATYINLHIAHTKPNLAHVSNGNSAMVAAAGGQKPDGHTGIGRHQLHDDGGTGGGYACDGVVDDWGGDE